MKPNFTILLSACLTLLMLASASFAQDKKANDSNTPSRVEIKAVNGKYHFYVNDQLFELKGVGGSGNLALLHQSGGNSIRTWGADKGMQLLDTARKYNLMVAMGLGMGQQLHGFNYNDTAAVAKQFNRIKKSVEELKNHPNLLCWVAGNELNLTGGNAVLNPAVYDALKDIVDYIHKTDPNHPVTSTMAGVNKKTVQMAMEHCPNLDFLSLQVYADLGRMPEIVKAAGITKPYAVTEYGPRGHWEGPLTAWGREIEETSSVKAAGIMKRIQIAFVNDNSGLCLGGYAFVWGQKQERTPTWYGMFIKSGEASATVDELTKYWTGKYPSNRAPQVDSLKLEGKNAVENVYIKPGVATTAKIFASDPNNDPLTYKWFILKEVKVRSAGGAHEAEPETINIEVVSDKNGVLAFKSPAVEGEYRLFCYVFDGKNKVGTANFPFYVK
ncbi:MAG TPA: glycoside hydrolase family 2 TIM barrel-domain containing protein [Prolixibacteraceae bacterium]